MNPDVVRDLRGLALPIVPLALRDRQSVSDLIAKAIVAEFA